MLLSLQGELSYDGHEIRVFDFLTQKSTKHTARNNAPGHFGMSGHGGADYHLMEAFISAVAVRAYKCTLVFINIEFPVELIWLFQYLNSFHLNLYLLWTVELNL